MLPLLSARILTGFIAVVLASVMVGGLWMKSGLGTVPLLIVSAFLVYISVVIACMLGEYIFRMLNRKK